MIYQGDIYWVDLGIPLDSEPGYRRPFLVIQNNFFNQSGLRTIVGCSLTTSLRRASAPGNVLLEKGEAGLVERSVVLISEFFTLPVARLEEYIGTISYARLLQVLDGLRLLTEPYDIDEDKD